MSCMCVVLDVLEELIQSLIFWFPEFSCFNVKWLFCKILSSFRRLVSSQD